MPEEQVTTKAADAPATPNIDALATKIAAALAPSFATMGEQIAKAVANPQTVRVAAQPVADTEIEVRRMVMPARGCDFDAKDVKDFNLGRLVRAALLGDFRRYAPLELEMCSYAAKREEMRGVVPEGSHVITKDMVGSLDPKGGFLIPGAILDAKIEPLLKEEVSLWKLGVKKYTRLKKSPMTINRVTGDPTVYDYVGDVPNPTAVTASDMTLDQLEMRPRTAAARTKISMDLIEDSEEAAEEMVLEAIKDQIGLKIEYNGYQGSGTNGAPQGIFDADGIWTVTSFGGLAADTAYDKLSEMISKLEVARALKGNLGWAIPTAAKHALRTMKDLTTQPKTRRILSGEGIEERLLGYPYVASTNVPNNKIMFGDWSKVAYGEWGTMFLALDRLTVLGVFQVQVLARMRYDWACRQEKSFCQSVSLTGAP